MKYLAFKDKYRRKYLANYELEKIRIKSILRSRSIPKGVRFLYSQKMDAFPKNASITRIKSRCVLTGRAQSVSRIFSLNRSCIRELMGQNFLPGLKKSCW